MITITARINLSERGGTINTGFSTLSGNNVSADVDDIIGKRSVKLGNPFILGSSKLDSGATYTDKLPYFMGSQLSNAFGDFPSSYTLILRGDNISSAIIVFDKENGGHPNSIIVDDETLYDDDAQFEIVFKNPSDEQTITITNWNKPYSPLIITSIYADISIDIDKNNLISFNSDIIDRSNTQYPSYGIISNSANLNVADFDEQILDLIQQQVLHSNIKVEVYLNNTLSNKEENICVMETRELSYDNDNRQVQILLKDNLEEWQEINIEAISYYLENGTERSPQTAQWYYEELYKRTPSKYNMQSFSELDSETQSILSGTTIQYPLLEADTLWNDWQKLCELCLLHIYVNNNGKTICKYNGGN